MIYKADWYKVPVSHMRYMIEIHAIWFMWIHVQKLSFNRKALHSPEFESEKKREKGFV